MASEAHAEVQQLVVACLAGDQSGMSRLSQRFRGPVLGLCYRMLGQWQDAEDAAQDTFLRVARSLERWDATREFEPWLLAIAANCCRSQLKRRKLRPNHVSLLPEAEDPVAPSQQHQWAADMLAEEVDSALQKLPANSATAFRMFHERSMTYKQIALELGRPEGTVKTWVHRARGELVRLLRRRGLELDDDGRRRNEVQP